MADAAIDGFKLDPASQPTLPASPREIGTPFVYVPFR